MSMIGQITSLIFQKDQFGYLRYKLSPNLVAYNNSRSFASDFAIWAGKRRSHWGGGSSHLSWSLSCSCGGLEA